MYRRKPWKKWAAMYLFAHKSYWTVIREWIRQCMKRPENWWLSGSEIPLVAFPYILFPFTFPPFPHTFPHVSPIDYWVFPMFFLVFLPVSYFRSYIYEMVLKLKWAHQTCYRRQARVLANFKQSSWNVLIFSLLI